MGSYIDNMAEMRKITTLTMALLLVSLTMSMPPYLSSRGACVSSLCSNDGDLLCEILCAVVVGDTQGIQNNNNNNNSNNNKTKNNNNNNKNSKEESASVNGV